MSKKGTYNSSFFSKFSTRLHGTAIRLGVLIGGPAAGGQRDVVFAAPTPPQPCTEGQEAPVVKDVAAHLKSKAGAAYATWVQSHISALRKLLPAGLEPCGIFVVVGEAVAKDLAPLLAPILKGIEEALVLTIDPSSQKITFWQYSGGAKAVLRPADVKADKQQDALLLWTATPLDLVIQSSGSATEDRCRAVEKSALETLERCTCAVVLGNDAPARIVDRNSEATLATVAASGCDTLQVSFLHGGTCLSVPESDDGDSRLRQRCLVVATCVFVRRNMELRVVAQLLRAAVAASAAERLRLAFEEAEADAEGGDADGAPGTAAVTGPLMLPWRALFRPQDLGLPLWCGDYCMPDEDADAARERLGQLLGYPEDAFEVAPSFLNEHAKLERDHVGTYKPNAATGGVVAAAPQAAGKASAAVPLPALACAAAVVVLLAAMLVPVALGN